MRDPRGIHGRLAKASRLTLYHSNFFVIETPEHPSTPTDFKFPTFSMIDFSLREWKLILGRKTRM